MGELIKIQHEEKRPQLQCPKCGKIQYIDIEIFKQDISKIYRDKCVSCGVELHVGIMILVHPTLKGLLFCLQKIIEAINPGTFLKL